MQDRKDRKQPLEGREGNCGKQLPHPHSGGWGARGEAGLWDPRSREQSPDSRAQRAQEGRCPAGISERHKEAVSGSEGTLEHGTTCPHGQGDAQETRGQTGSS